MISKNKNWLDEVRTEMIVKVRTEIISWCEGKKWNV